MLLLHSNLNDILCQNSFCLGRHQPVFSWGLWLDETCPSYGAQLKSHKSVDFYVILTKKIFTKMLRLIVEQITRKYDPAKCDPTHKLLPPLLPLAPHCCPSCTLQCFEHLPWMNSLCLHYSYMSFWSIVFYIYFTKARLRDRKTSSSSYLVLTSLSWLCIFLEDKAGVCLWWISEW